PLARAVSARRGHAAAAGGRGPCGTRGRFLTDGAGGEDEPGTPVGAPGAVRAAARPPAPSRPGGSPGRLVLWRQLATTGFVGPYPEHHVDLRDGPRPLRRPHRAEHLAPEC